VKRTAPNSPSPCASFAVCVLAWAGPVAAQSPPAADPNPGSMTLTGSFDVVSTYMFRGIRQHSTGIALWPVADLGLAVYSGDGVLKTAGVNFGTWNSLHTGDTGLDSASGKFWYESDFYASLGLGFGGGTSLTTTYTAYTSPNNTFTTVKEIAVKVAVDDTAYLGRAAVRPYALVAFEFDTELFTRQADSGASAGRYLELGVAPGYVGAKASIAVPIKVGLSLADYYELNTGTPLAPVFVESTFGYFSIAGLVTVPIGGTTRFGSWNVHGGVEFQQLGDTTKVLNGGDAQRVIGSIGIGFSY
jgi:hypothetical protein